ncbi:Transposase OrfAB, subunit B [Methylomonas albis]|nr:Transposase OrfAB, subunit B [Methylomonas albis]
MTPCRDALQVFSASLRKPAQRYGYRGLKIFTSLSLRFQDFQRRPNAMLDWTRRY